MNVPETDSPMAKVQLLFTQGTLRDLDPTRADSHIRKKLEIIH
jgi:hypothetical protein